VTITAPPGERIVRIDLTWIHIRPSHPQQVPMGRIFPRSEVRGARANLGVSPGAPATLTLAATSPDLDSVTVKLVTGALKDSGLEAHHAYLWPRVHLTTNAGERSYDFCTRGLSYYGG
jgi:hypothetical protein